MTAVEGITGAAGSIAAADIVSAQKTWPCTGASPSVNRTFCTVLQSMASVVSAGAAIGRTVPARTNARPG